MFDRQSLAFSAGVAASVFVGHMIGDRWDIVLDGDLLIGVCVTFLGTIVGTVVWSHIGWISKQFLEKRSRSIILWCGVGLCLGVGTIGLVAIWMHTIVAGGGRQDDIMFWLAWATWNSALYGFAISPKPRLQAGVWG